MRPTDFNQATDRHLPEQPTQFRLAADLYLDLRCSALVWFEQLGLIRAERAEVVLESGLLDVLLALAGPRPNTLPAPSVDRLQGREPPACCSL